MKKWLAAVLVLVAALGMTVGAGAEEANISRIDELLSERDTLCRRLGEINVEIGAIRKEAAFTAPEEALGSLGDLFPDEALALIVRDRLAKFSIKQRVTQTELDQVTGIALFSGGDFGYVADLTGIGHLRNLNRLAFYNGSAKNLTTLPSELFQLTALNELDVSQSAIAEIPEEIGSLINLTSLDIGSTNIEKLPDNVGLLVNLKELSIRNTNISTLPNSIGNLTALKSLNIEYTKIQELPEVIYGLNLTELSMAGTAIK
jgi:hypothetical protein